MAVTRIRSRPASGGGGGPVEVVEAFVDGFSLNVKAEETNAVPTDVEAFLLRFAQSDTIDAQTETTTLTFPAGDFGDTNPVPSETNSFTLRCWLSGSTGGMNPGNADGQNNGTVATLQTAVAGAANVSLLSALGANVPSAVITSAIYRGWFRSVNTLVTSAGILHCVSAGGLFPDAEMFRNAALNTTVDRLDGSFTYDLIANGINTLAKIQSIQMRHRTEDAVAGVTPHVLTVDAGCVELSGAFT